MSGIVAGRRAPSLLRRIQMILCRNNCYTFIVACKNKGMPEYTQKMEQAASVIGTRKPCFVSILTLLTRPRRKEEQITTDTLEFWDR